MKTQTVNDAAKTDASDSVAERILDAAVHLAHSRSWEAIRLHQVADEMGLELQELYQHFKQKDDLVEAWYDRADRAMLADAAQEDYRQLSVRARFHRSIMCWLTSMQAHRDISRQMLAYKFELGHVHLQVLGLLRISRTVQWILESAHRDAVHVQRVLEEISLTSIYLATFAHWMFDSSRNAVKTSRYLDRLLSRAEAMALLFTYTGTKHSQQGSAVDTGQSSARRSDFEGNALH